MKHAYVVFDNDAPLFVCTSKEQAEGVLLTERQRLRQAMLKVDGSLSPVQQAEERKRAEEQLSSHYLHYYLVPFALTDRSGAANTSPERKRG